MKNKSGDQIPLKKTGRHRKAIRVGSLNKKYMTLLFLGLGRSELIIISIFLIPIASYWKIFEKAEQPGWAALIPIYNLIILMKIINKPWWWALLCIIPYLGIIWIIWSNNLMVKRFGKTEAFTIGIVLLAPIFLPILAFGNFKYIKE